MKIYKTINKDTIIFTFVPDGIVNFFKNKKRQCHYGIFFKFNKIQRNKFSYSWFNFKKDFKKINKIIQENELIETDLFYVLDFIKNNAYSESMMIYEKKQELNPVAAIVNQLSSYILRDYLIFKDIQKTILEDEQKRYIEDLDNKNYILVKGEMILNNEPFTISSYRNNMFLGYIHFTTGNHIFIVDDNLKINITTYKTLKEISNSLEEYKKLFLNKDIFNIQKRIKTYIDETINIKLKRNEKRRLLKKQFHKLKNLISIYTYLQNDKGDDYGNI